MSNGNHGTSEISYAKSARVGPLGLFLCPCGRGYEAGCAEIRVAAWTEIDTITSSCLHQMSIYKLRADHVVLLQGIPSRRRLARWSSIVLSHTAHKCSMPYRALPVAKTPSCGLHHRISVVTQWASINACATTRVRFHNKIPRIRAHPIRTTRPFSLPPKRSGHKTI